MSCSATCTVILQNQHNFYLVTNYLYKMANLFQLLCVFEALLIAIFMMYYKCVDPIRVDCICPFKKPSLSDLSVYQNKSNAIAQKPLAKGASVYQSKPNEYKCQLEKAVGLRAIHGSNIYTDFVNGNDGPANRHVYSDLVGWGIDYNTLHEILERFQPNFVVEVGSWKGLSAVTMANWMLKHIKGDCKIIVCVDTWLGTTKAWLEPEQNGNTLYRKAGYPSVYYQFLFNVISAKVTDIVVPLPLPGTMGAIFMQKKNAAPDLIFIDGCHDYACVLEDIRAWYPVVRINGALFGDDVDRKEVLDAVKEAARSLDATFTIHGRCWLLVK